MQRLCMLLVGTRREVSELVDLQGGGNVSFGRVCEYLGSQGAGSVPDMMVPNT
jgi:hypothetical protein